MRPDLLVALRVAAAIAFVGVALGEAWLFAALLSSSVPVARWMLCHGAFSLLAGAACLAWLPAAATREWGHACRMAGLVASLAALLPLAGAVGAPVALVLGARASARRHRDTVYWQFTDNPALPFTTPVGRPLPALDGRGLAERLSFGVDADALYRQVLAAGRMRASLSIDALQAGIRHADERIRLTAYQTLDRKVSRLNDEIDRLERVARQREGGEASDTWLQVASCYWELLTLEQGEPVARRQLLEKAETAAMHAIEHREDNRNAHFTLGRIALRRGEPALADAALVRATELGMPTSTTLPYRAEAAFDRREFGRVRALLAEIDEAFTAYPPLAEVASQWR